MTSARPSQLAATAHHEAGHVVAAWRLGYRPWSVTIVPSEGRSGLAVFNNPLARMQIGRVGHSDRARLRIERAILISLAGPVAQRAYRPRSFRSWHSSADYVLAADLALHICGSGESAGAFLRWLEIRAKEMVGHDWSVIEALARKLVECRTIEGEALEEMLVTPEE